MHRCFKITLVKKQRILKKISIPMKSLVPSTLIVYNEFSIPCFIHSVTTEVIFTATVRSFYILGHGYVSFRGVVLMIARKRDSFSIG